MYEYEGKLDPDKILQICGDKSVFICSDSSISLIRDVFYFVHEGKFMRSEVVKREKRIEKAVLDEELDKLAPTDFCVKVYTRGKDWLEITYFECLKPVRMSREEVELILFLKKPTLTDEGKQLYEQL